MVRKTLIICMLILTTVTLYSEGARIDYAKIVNEVNEIRRSVGSPDVTHNIDLAELAKLQVEAMIEHGAMEHNLTPEEDKRGLKMKAMQSFNVNKSYITIRVFELIARMPVNSLLKAEIVIPHVYDTSSRHFSVLTDFNAEAMGWYVSEDDGTYWISTYVLMRYYQ